MTRNASGIIPTLLINIYLILNSPALYVQLLKIVVSCDLLGVRI